ncbi:MAG: sugar metabolism transcriptional regulator [Oscillatoriales cyanobacterium RU_3_3]|nr:sugar metabolism transcriptional regulator [Microcoleus sp. SU_5_6]NJL67557.1 sugar metabolism transcriptional regulator [Microcoleus sp. SM1_3_4]NJM59104.1 sugar metabolism transcriptional regulator [Oscillatoriales cyanobacterium RU_3_3]NJR26371.1 sugar metabolism transcriptional regulator [Richelia sp. CSU_2_1]
MILSEIQQFIAANKRASIADLKLHFRTDGDALRRMLDRLVRKGRISKMPEAKKCGGCCSCSDDATEIYVWVNADRATPAAESVSLNCH